MSIFHIKITNLCSEILKSEGKRKEDLTNYFILGCNPNAIRSLAQIKMKSKNIIHNCNMVFIVLVCIVHTIIKCILCSQEKKV